MKKYIIISFLLVLVGFAVYYGRKIFNALKMTVGVESFRPVSKLVDIFLGITLRLKLKIGNYSNSTFSVSQIQMTVYTVGGVSVADQKEPLKEAIVILPNINNYPELDFNLSYQGLVSLIMTSGLVTPSKTAINVISDYLITGKFGLTINLKGFVVAEGFKVSIDEKVDI